MSNLIYRLQNEILKRKIAVTAAHQHIKRAEREAKRDKTSVPAFQMDQMMEEVRFCRNQLESAQISYEAASKYPPCSTY